MSSTNTISRYSSGPIDRPPYMTTILNPAAAHACVSSVRSSPLAFANSRVLFSTAVSLDSSSPHSIDQPAPTLDEIYAGANPADDAGLATWSPPEGTTVTYPRHAKLLPLVSPTDPNHPLYRTIPTSHAYVPPGTLDEERAAHAVALETLVVPPSVVCPLPAPTGSSCPTDGSLPGWIRPGVDDDPLGMREMPLNSVILAYDPTFTLSSDDDDPAVYYASRPQPSLASEGSPLPPSSPSPVSNLNSQPSLCGLNLDGIKRFLGEEHAAAFDELQELVIGNPKKNLPSFKSLKPQHNSKGAFAYNLGGSWVIVSQCVLRQCSL